MNTSAKIVAYSTGISGHNIASMELVFPRFILAELNTHRLFSRNSASSRAIPFEKMVTEIMDNPFIPIAWQKAHRGMQGSEYLDDTLEYSILEFTEIVSDTFKKSNSTIVALISQIFEKYKDDKRLLKDWWLLARDRAVESALLLHIIGVSKQICNRLIETFMWHKVLLTATEWENFFELRCPVYDFGFNDGRTFKSIKEYEKSQTNEVLDWNGSCGDFAYNLVFNKGQSEIHMMALAEVMYDALNASVPKLLKHGEWHIPYEDFIDDAIYDDFWNDIEDNCSKSLCASDIKELTIKRFNEWILKVSTALCAKTSYTVAGEGIKQSNYLAEIKLYDKLLNSKHLSPFEHCAMCIDDEYNFYYKGKLTIASALIRVEGGLSGEIILDDNNRGWCDNFRGFRSYRNLLQDSIK